MNSGLHDLEKEAVPEPKMTSTFDFFRVNGPGLSSYV